MMPGRAWVTAAVARIWPCCPTALISHRFFGRALLHLFCYNWHCNAKPAHECCSVHLVTQRSAWLLQRRDASVLAVPEELLQPHRLQLLLCHAGSVLGVPLLRGSKGCRDKRTRGNRKA
jgi:hypothetical protein